MKERYPKEVAHLGKYISNWKASPTTGDDSLIKSLIYLLDRKTLYKNQAEYFESIEELACYLNSENKSVDLAKIFDLFLDQGVQYEAIFDFFSKGIKIFVKLGLEWNNHQIQNVLKIIFSKNLGKKFIDAVLEQS